MLGPDSTACFCSGWYLTGVWGFREHTFIGDFFLYCAAGLGFAISDLDDCFIRFKEHNIYIKFYGLVNLKKKMFVEIFININQ